MAKKVIGQIKLHIAAGKATPAPPIGPALSQNGLNPMEFCKQFNAKTQANIGDILPTVITVYSDRSYTFITKVPPASQLIKKAAGLEKGSSAPNKDKVGKLTKAQLRELAEKKMEDMTAANIEAAMRTIAGTARSMGVEIVD